MQQHFHGQQPVLVLTQAPSEKDSLKPRSAGHLYRISITQIVMGTMCILMGAILAGFSHTHPYSGSYLATFGYGVWIGIFLLIIGVVGARAAKTSNHCMITASMILNILFSILGCLGLVYASVFSLTITTWDSCYDYDGHYDDIIYDDIVNNTQLNSTHWNATYLQRDVSTTDVPLYTTWNDGMFDCDEVSTLALFFDSVMVVIALTQFILCIVVSAICCGAVCRCCKQQVGATIQYFARPQQVFVQPALYPSVPNRDISVTNPVHGIQQPGMYSGMQVMTGAILMQQPVTQQLATEQSVSDSQYPTKPPAQPAMAPTASSPVMSPSTQQTAIASQQAPVIPATTQPNLLSRSRLPPINLTSLTRSDGETAEMPPTYSSLA